MSNLFTLLLVTGVLQPSKAQSVCSSALALKYERQERLSDGYHVFWSVDSAAQRLTFGFCVATQGWIGFGLSPSDGMKGADVMIARRDADSGEFEVGDYFSEDFVTPVLDQQQDWHLVQGQRNLSHTFVEVWRSIKTCDDLDHDFKLLPQRAVYAYGYSDAIKQHAPTSRGSLLMKFLSPWLTPPEQGTTIVDVRMPNVTLPAKHSFYHCAVVSMDLPTNTRLHATAWTILPGSSPYKHHQFMYNCPPEVLESYELNTAFSCDNIMPDVCHLVANVGNNEEVVVLPAETGLPLGGTDEDCASFSDSSFPCVRLALLEFHMEVTT